MSIRRIKHRLKTLFIGSRNLKIEREERYLMIIVRKLLNSQESELLMVPDMSKFYIKSENNGIFVVADFNTNVASVINHKFGYDIKMKNARVLKYVVGNFTKVVEQRRQEMENEYRRNIQHTLSSVLNNIKVEKPKTNSNENSITEQVENA